MKRVPSVCRPMYPPLPGVAVNSHIMAQYEWFAFCVICTRWSMFQNPLAPWKFHIAYSLASWCCAACLKRGA